MKVSGFFASFYSILILIPLYGQITIDWTEVPHEIGVAFNHNGVSDVTVNLGTTGGPQTWSFSSQPMGPQNTHALIVPRTSTPFGDSFPDANLVLQITQDSDTAYAYGQISSSFGSNLGLGSVSPLVTFFRFEPTDSYPLPVVYGASRSYQYGYTLALNSVMDLRTDNFGFETIDAHGSVIIPYDTFECLRMCSFDTSISTILVGGFPISVDTTTHVIYDFLAEDFGLIAHILSNPEETNPNFTAASFLERLNDYSTGITESKIIAVVNFSCQPNPFTKHTNIRCQIMDDESTNSDVDVDIRIYDANGRLVREFEHVSVIDHQISVVWDGTDEFGRQVGSGAYFLRLNIDGTCTSRKILLVR
ncbi:MAG: T9SS type A sorting domain-containing protein [candidate division WOR-3 bacterium]|nr:MAG: T9SS type A sorting domain-containing protein [candidate division WOR-3 bacterium]